MEKVDAVVVGSGFGGSVSAYRLAEAGQRVVLMERGQPYPPGSFPRSPAEMNKAFWDPAEGLYGMYDVWGFHGFDSVVSSGLGGGSLLYANVMLRKDEHWFVKDEEMPGGGYESWPVTRADLDPHYDVVEKMLDVTPYPLDRAPFDDTPKTHAMQDAAAELGLAWSLPPLAVSFAPERGAEPGVGLPIVDAGYGNVHGVPRRTCRLCGECDIGCNDGAKNSLDHNYLSAAKHHGADIRTSHEVKAIRPRDGGGYEVDYVHHLDLESKARKSKVQTIACDRLILAAGTYGTTYLLLKSRKNLPGLSKALGTRFSGNGDLLTFLLKAKDRNRVRPLDASRGPVITSTIRLPDELDGFPGAGRGAYIQDGGYPGFVDWMVQPLEFNKQIERAVEYLWRRFKETFKYAPDTNISKELSDLIGDGALTVSSLPLLGMGRDTADGVLELKDGRLNAEWTTKTSEEHFERLRKTMQGIADVLGADYADNPMWFRKRIITAHPLGGAPMGDHVDEGVCDAFGEVFGFPGLYIADGAAMPGPVGPNPSLTIAALADRMSTRLLEGSPVTGAGPVRETGPLGEPEGETTSLSFTEEMKGFVTYGVTDPRAGALSESKERMSFRLTITADDVARFLDEPEHTARAEGWIDNAGCGGRRDVERGWFNLFAPGGAEERRLMKYRLHFTDAEGRLRTLAGEKNVLHGPPTRIWPDTSTLYFHLYEGHVEEGEEAPVAGAGVLHIQLTDFARQLTTFRTHGPGGPGALIRFGRFFAGELWEVYGPDLT
ncbi:GMC family oxidoreductase [Actinomadura barringtoniae]|uniref:Cholesterol oxidase n=1 Tax=Actinomadura barringtoniae TaxID=1427535 RepID=A0A939T957_9ACTN|nr:GMC family oxidoreductase [Actinomadura barringtoniae]MBO2451027.1 GMC family oxidoreductase [Actinomadura barringtoniae]